NRRDAKLPERQRYQYQEDQADAEQDEAVKPLVKKEPGDKRPPDDVSFLHWSRDNHSAGLDREVVGKQSEGGKGSRAHKGKNSAAPHILLRSRPDLAERTVFPHQKNTQQQARQPAKKRANQRVRLGNRNPVKDIGRSVSYD